MFADMAMFAEQVQVFVTISVIVAWPRNEDDIAALMARGSLVSGRELPNNKGSIELNNQGGA